MHRPTVRLPLEKRELDLIEEWRRSQPKIPSRRGAVKDLVKLGLEESKRQAKLPTATKLA